MTNGWRDAQRRESASSAIRDARRRLACTVRHLSDLDDGHAGWEGRCGECGTVARFGTLHEFEEWATQHECEGETNANAT